jgi:hypothetical protein
MTDVIRYEKRPVYARDKRAENEDEDGEWFKFSSVSLRDCVANGRDSRAGSGFSSSNCRGCSAVGEFIGQKLYDCFGDELLQYVFCEKFEAPGRYSVSGCVNFASGYRCGDIRKQFDDGIREYLDTCKGCDPDPSSSERVYSLADQKFKLLGDCATDPHCPITDTFAIKNIEKVLYNLFLYGEAVEVYCSLKKNGVADMLEGFKQQNPSYPSRNSYSSGRTSDLKRSRSYVAEDEGFVSDKKRRNA